VRSFPRSRRLKRHRLIKLLFDRHASSVIRCGCIRLHYAIVPRSSTGTDSPVQVGFAPNRQKTKVLRNRLRRIMRETWRINQHVLDTGSINSTSTLIVMALSRPPADEMSIRRDMTRVMRRLNDTLADAQPGGS